MSKGKGNKRKRSFSVTLVTGRGLARYQAVVELRSSGASGKHKNKADKGRAENRRRAIQEQS